jgi:threonylcarbamoyladenosine tRNA methylthiotransferase MtaB
VIVGFPGETEAEFAETVDFIRAMKFAGGHVFTYSARPGTPASHMKGQVRLEVRKERNAVLRKLFTEAAQVYASKFVGQTLSVLWESSDQLSDRGWRMEGLSGNYLRVMAVASEPRWNQVDRVMLTGLSEDGLMGELQEKFEKISFV